MPSILPRSYFPLKINVLDVSKILLRDKIALNKKRGSILGSAHM